MYHIDERCNTLMVDAIYLLEWSTLIMARCCARTQISEMRERQNYDSTIAIAMLSQLPVLKHNSIGCTQVESNNLYRGKYVLHIYIIYECPLPSCFT